MLSAYGADFDLGNGNPQHSGAAALGGAASTTITVGGSPMTVTPSSTLSAAEYIAAIQSLTPQGQTLTVNLSGVATGGSFATHQINQSIGSLTIPSGVTGVQNFALSQTLNLSGILTNSGSLFGVSTQTGTKSGTFFASSILNNQGGFIGTALQGQTVGGITNIVANLGLNLHAITSIINYGTIASAGNLNVVAGTSFINGSVNNLSAVTQATQNLSIITGNLTNFGTLAATLQDINIRALDITNANTIRAMNGDVLIQSAAGTSLNLNNNSGVIQALNEINLEIDRDASSSWMSSIYSGGSGGAQEQMWLDLYNNPQPSPQMTVTGGTLAGSEVDLDVRFGALSVNIEDLQAPLTMRADSMNIAINHGTQGLDIKGLSHVDAVSLVYHGTGLVAFNGLDTMGGLIDIVTDGDINIHKGDSLTGAPDDLNASNTTGEGGAGGNVNMQGRSIRVGDITTDGSAGGNGGGLTLVADQGILAGLLSASATGGGSGGAISATAGAGGSGDINIAGAVANTGGSIVLTTPGDINVSGDLIAIDGSITMSAVNTNIGGTVNTGNGAFTFNPGDSASPFVLNLAQLAGFGTSSLNIGNGNTTRDLVVNTNCNGCLGNLDHLKINTKGSYTATGTILTLESVTEFEVHADNGLHTGSVSGGKSISFSANGQVDVDGDLTTSGAIALHGHSNNGQGLAIGLGKHVTGESISIGTDAGDIVSGGVLHATHGALAVASAGNLTLLGSSDLEATDGNLGLLSAGDIQVGSGVQLTADGGNLWMSAGNDVILSNNVQITSVGRLADGSPASGMYSTLPEYVGGGVAIMAGAPEADMNAILAGLAAGRDGTEIKIVPGSFNMSSNTINSSGGSVFAVVFPQGTAKDITNSTFTLNGGVIYIDPPTAGNDVILNGANITAVGPQLAAPSVDPGTGGGATTGAAALSAAAAGIVTTQNTLDASALSAAASGVNNVASNRSSREAVRGSDVSNTGVVTASNSPYCPKPQILDAEDGSSDGNWIMSANKCQPFSFQSSDGSIIIGSGPAIFAPSINRSILLKEGKLLLASGDNLLVVRTPICSITIPVNSAATIDYLPNGVARISAMAGGRVSVTVTREGETIILSAAPGEQMVLADGQQAQSELRCVPEVTNKRVDKWLIELSGLRGEKFAFDRAEMVAREELLNCSLGCFNKLQQSMLESIRQSMLEEQPKELKSQAPVHNRRLIARATHGHSHLSPVGFGLPMVEQEPIAIATLTCGGTVIKYTRGANIRMHGDTIKIDDGDALINARQNLRVVVGGFPITIKSGTLSMVCDHGNDVKVRNVYESQSTSIEVSVGKHHCVGLQVGHELIIVPQRGSISKALSSEPVGRRRVHHSEVPGGYSLVNCEVSLTSLMQNTDLLAQIMRSEDKEDRSINSRLMKMAAVLSMVTIGHGNYSMLGR